MAGLHWTDTGSGYLVSPTLSEKFRTALQVASRFRQFADVEVALGKNRGDTYSWNVYGDTEQQGTTLDDRKPMPETSFPIIQASVTITEAGIAVPYTGKLEALSEHDIRKIVFTVLKNDANRGLDTLAHAQFNSNIIDVVGTGANARTWTYNATPTASNNSALNKEHVKAIVDTMQERNIPTYDGEHYCCVTRPSTIRQLTDDIESMAAYTDAGWTRIVNGERGRYEGVRFVSQTHITAANSTTSGAEGFGDNGASDWAFFFGEDTVTEAVANPEELRAKVGDDYGRGKGIAWYYLGGFKITHADTTSTATRANARIVKWTSVNA